MEEWTEYHGDADQHGELVRVECPCGDTVDVFAGEVEACPTCGRRYRVRIAVAVETDGEGNGQQYVPPRRDGPRYGSIYFVRHSDMPFRDLVEQDPMGITRLENVRID